MGFRPTIVVFQCQFNLYDDPDRQPTKGFGAARVKVIRVPCSGRISPLFLLNAVQEGADGIMVCGCAPHKCHFTEGNFRARRQLDAFRNFLVYLGLEPQRIRFVWLDPMESGGLIAALEGLEEELRIVGPATRLVPRSTATVAGC
jgi:F420-non-reducing hydrogenase iron-sulfur subunit